jgi:hypothetical protein
MSTLNWKPWGMCGVQARLDSGETAIVDGYQIGNVGGFQLTHRYAGYLFTTRDDAYSAAELLNKTIGDYIGGES